MPARLPRSTTALAAVAGLIASGLAAVVLAPTAQADPAQPVPDCDAATTCTVTYGYTGAEETFTVPDGVTSVRAVVNGAPGGGYSGGEGGVTSGTLAVSPGDALAVQVGESGSRGGSTRTYGGGGSVTSGSDGGSGGGRSLLATDAGVRLIAGGGGGGGHLGRGGAGGGRTGGSSATSTPFTDYIDFVDPTGGDQTSGGAAGQAAPAGTSNYYPPGEPGDSPSVGDGGNGSNYGSIGRPIADGGGGGGGYHGGGGGSSNEGGGGGSGFFSDSAKVTNGLTTVGGSFGGSVVITYDTLATTTSLALSSAAVVHGQPVTATATVTGSSAGTVSFFVDGVPYDKQDVGVGGTATSRNLATAPPDPNIRRGLAPSGLTVGEHTITARFTPTDQSTYASSETATGSSLTVNPATSTTTIKVNAKTLVAIVTVDEPSTDTPTGSVTFLVGGKEVGTAPIVNGVATLDYAAPAGRAVAATYSGRGDANENTEVSPSSASTARSNPTVTAKVTSSKAKTKAGWYSTPVTVRFTCTAGSDAVSSCPTPVTVGRNGITTVKRTVLAKDGGVATINVTVKVDRSRPTVKITGVKAGGIYGALPSTRCAASDKVSGVTSCRVVHKAKGSKITYTAVATDRAGNTTKKTVTVRRSPALITGAKYGGALPVVKLGKGYTIVVTSKSRPSYVYAAPSPAKPKGDGGTFTKIGKNRWAYSVVFTKNLRGHSTWSFGVKTGKKTVVVKVRVKR